MGCETGEFQSSKLQEAHFYVNNRKNSGKIMSKISFSCSFNKKIKW